MKRNKLLAVLITVFIATTTVIGCNKSNSPADNRLPTIVENQIEGSEADGTAKYEIGTYKVLNPGERWNKFELEYVEVTSKKDDLLDLLNSTYKVLAANSDGYLSEEATVKYVEQVDGITYITLSEEFSRDWKGGNFYDITVFNAMTVSFCSINGIDEVKYKLEKEISDIYINLADNTFRKEYIENRYDIREMVEHEIAIYSFAGKDSYPLELEVEYSNVTTEKEELLELVQETYKRLVENSNGYLKEGSEVVDVYQDNYTTYIMLNDKFYEDWKGGSFYECIVFDTMTASFCSIDGIERVKYKLRKNVPDMQIDITSTIFTTEHLEENYNIVVK